MMRLLYSLSDAMRDRARRRRFGPNHVAGKRGEDLAHRFLRRSGFTVVARNYRSRSGSGEADIVAWEGDTLVIVEVKSRRTDEFGTPDRAVDSEKQQYLIRAAHSYARRANVPLEQVRFDIVSVLFTDPPSVTHIRDAFSARRAI